MYGKTPYMSMIIMGIIVTIVIRMNIKIGVPMVLTRTIDLQGHAPFAKPFSPPSTHGYPRCLQ
jgi:hypothetical protein